MPLHRSHFACLALVVALLVMAVPAMAWEVQLAGMRLGQHAVNLLDIYGQPIVICTGDGEQFASGGGAAAGMGMEGMGVEGMGMEGMPGGEPTEEEAVAELAAALDELGIPLEALAEAGGGGMPPEGGGEPMMPPPEGGGMEVAASDKSTPTEGQKLASAIQRFKQAGKYQFKQANDGTRARAIRDIMKGYLQEIMG